jgi:hypothetical protein
VPAHGQRDWISSCMYLDASCYVDARTYMPDNDTNLIIFDRNRVLFVLMTIILYALWWLYFDDFSEDVSGRLGNNYPISSIRLLCLIIVLTGYIFRIYAIDLP